MKMDTPSTTITAPPSRRAIYPINAPPSFVAPRPCLPHWCPGHRHITGDRGSPVPWHWLLSDEPVLRVHWAWVRDSNDAGVPEIVFCQTTIALVPNALSGFGWN